MVKKEIREEWRKLANKAMHSWVGEYCPKDEFFALLDYIDELEAAQQSAGAGDVGCSHRNVNPISGFCYDCRKTIMFTPRR